MTREEVINILYEIKEDNIIPGDAQTQDKYEALEMVITWLEQEPKTDVLDKISAEIRKEMTESGKSNVKEYGIDDRNGKYEQCFLAGVYRCLAIITKYKAESEVRNDK